ncbi:MAG: ion transporter [Actinomycetota bacterium]|nr:ion transporter [Actinomycetota bacterium]
MTSVVKRPEPAEDAFDVWVERITERADPFMAWLGIVFALLVGYELAVELRGPVARALEIAGWAIWAVFLLEFAAKVSLAPRKLRFLRRHWLQLLMLALPALRVLRFLRLLRLGRALPAGRVVSASYRSAGTAKRLARSRLGYLAGLSVIGAIALAELAFLLERGERDGAFDSFADALLWSFSTVLALQADPVPTSVGGRIAMLVGFALGLVLVASLAGTVGAYLIDERRERAEATLTREP